MMIRRAHGRCRFANDLRPSVPPRAQRPRPTTAVAGFTLLELLVAIGVIGLLTALLLPAVQSAREAARRTQCLSHLRQIGLALHAYESAYACFPPAFQYALTGQGPNRHSLDRIHSPLARMLPQLEQNPLFHATNFDFDPRFGAGIDANRTVMRTAIALFLCPSDHAPVVPGYGRVNYHFNYGPNAHDGFPEPGVDTTLGAFGSYERAYRPADFTDGLASTAGVSERCQGDWTSNRFDPAGDYKLGDIDYRYLDRDQALLFCQALQPESANRPHESRGGESWFLSGYHFTGYNHVATPNRYDQTCSLDRHTGDINSRFNHGGSFPPTSRHPGGVNLLAMDGSVRFVTNAIPLPTWRALSTRHGNETLPADPG